MLQLNCKFIRKGHGQMSPELPAEEDVEKAPDLATSTLVSSELCPVAGPTEARRKVLATSSAGCCPPDCRAPQAGCVDAGGLSQELPGQQGGLLCPSGSGSGARGRTDRRVPGWGCGKLCHAASGSERQCWAVSWVCARGARKPTVGSLG